VTVPLREVQEMHDTMLATFLSRVRATPDRVALEELAAGGAPADLSLTWTQWREASRSFAAALIADGVQRGDRVAILAGNRALWPIADIGILMAGAISAGVYPTSAPAQIRELLSDCGAVAIVVDTADQLQKVTSVAHELPSLRRIVAAELEASSGIVRRWRDYLGQGASALASSAETGDPHVSSHCDGDFRSVEPSGDSGGLCGATGVACAVPNGVAPLGIRRAASQAQASS